MTKQTEEWQKAQDQLKLLKYYDIPVIDGKEHHEGEEKHHKRHQRQKKKERNPILAFLKKCLYFKPKTFMGATILAAVLTTVSGAVMTSCFQGARRHHRDKRPIPMYVEQKSPTNAISKVETQAISQVLKQLYMLYQLRGEYLLHNNGAVFTCMGCGDTVQEIKTTNGKDVQMTCIECQKPFQNLLPQVIKQEELTR